MSSRTALALILLFLTSCHSHLTAMQRLDLLVTAAAQLCPKGALEKPTQTKLLDCRRADTCLRPVAAAQHAHQDALLAMSRMEDSSGLRLAAEAATAGAIASCRVVGIVGGAVAPVPVVPVVPVVPAAPANPVPTATPTPAPATVPVAAPAAPVVPAPTLASTPAPAASPQPAPAPQPAVPTQPTTPTPAP